MAGQRCVRNILFIMFDQLRWDYLGCAGHPALQTPNLDWLAGRGVRFTRAYAQSPVCGPSRMSFYTGRYCHSHGAQWNGYPLSVGEMTLGDHMRALGLECWLVGKTHMAPDRAGMKRLGISAEGAVGIRLMECGFDTWIRDDGLWSEGPDGAFSKAESPYNAFLRSRGYTADNPWLENANSAVDEDGNIASGWMMKNAGKPANIREEDSETPWLTDRTLEYLQARGDERWLCHVSYIKPHWPYIAPAPYNGMFGAADVPAAVRTPQERQQPHPVLEAFQSTDVSRAFHRSDVRNTVIPAYMGLIRQCDDQLGRLFEYLQGSGRMDDTLIVVTSDHGDYLGDHWLGDKDLMHDCAVKIPLIIHDPSAAADRTRGTTCDALVEGIDLAATFVEAAGGQVPGHIVEGRSLVPFLHGSTPSNWREFVVSEYDYAMTQASQTLGLKPDEARLFMAANRQWKLIHSMAAGHRPILFDLQRDPAECEDLGGSAGHADIVGQMYGHLAKWAMRMSQRTTRSDEELDIMRGKARRRGIVLGLYDGSEAPDELTACFRGRANQIITAAQSMEGA